MKILAILISGISVTMIALTWNTPAAMAWTVAFCGWLPHVFDKNRETVHGQS